MASRSSRTWIVVSSVAGVLVIGGVVVAAIAMRQPPPPPPDAPVTEIMKFAATDRWAKLPPEQLQKYYDQFDAMSWPERMQVFQQLQGLSEDERRRAMENFMGTRMVNQARKYVRLSPEEQKKELDRLIDQQQSMMANMPRMPFPTSRPGGEGRGGWGGGGGGWNNPAAQKDRLERMPPGDRAAMSKFIGDLAQRRAERGLGGWGPGGGGGAGGSGRPGAGGGGTNQR